MHFNIYDNKLLTSKKCGTRYLDSIYGVPNLIYDLIPFSKLNLNDIKWVVIRPPMDLLITAVHTELLLNWIDNIDKNTEKDIIHNLISTDWMCAHYQFNLYKEMFLKSIDYPDIKFVKLEDLTEFCESELNLYKPYKPTDFDFSGVKQGVKRSFNINKNTTMDYLKLAYPYYYSTLMKNIPIDEFFYNLIINSKKLWKVENKEDYQKEDKKIL